MRTRRQVLQRAALAAGLAACGLPAVIRPARAADKITVFSPFGFTPEYSDLFNAYSGGHFAKQGLDAAVLATRGAQSVQQLVAGQADFIRNVAVDIITAISAQGLPLVCIATLGQASSYRIVSLKDKPVLTVPDLKGKNVGIITAQGGASSTYLAVLLASAGIKRDDVNMLVTGNSPGELQYLKDGRIDCFLCTLDVAATLDIIGAPVTYWSTDKYVRLPGFVHVTRRDIVEGKPEIVQRYMRAIKASVYDFLTLPLKTIFERESKDFEMEGMKDMDLAVKLQQISIDDIWLAAGRDNVLRNMPGLWQSGVDALGTIGYKNLKPATEYYTNRFIDAA